MTLPPFSSFDAIDRALQILPVADQTFIDKAISRQNILTKPSGALGKLEELAIFMAGWQAVEIPKIDLAQTIIFAGNHGVCAQGINPFPQTVTKAMVQNMRQGGAAINQLCKVSGAEIHIIELELEQPTNDITVAPALREEECLDAFNQGVQAVRDEADIVLLGEMGIGNSTISSALCLGMFGGATETWVGVGTGADAAMQARKARVIAQAAVRHKEALTTPFGVLCALGGREQAAICGAMVAGRLLRVPVLVDGFIGTAAIAPFYKYDGMFDHVIIAHKSAEAGHALLLKHIHKTALLDLNMRLGEGSGAAVALSIMRGALACHKGMASFAEAGIE